MVLQQSTQSNQKALTWLWSASEPRLIDPSYLSLVSLQDAFNQETGDGVGPTVLYTQ